MAKIKLLPTHLINQIAAGEVVERPASVVKELVENALDADATQIRINVTQGGTQKITVTDNGSGMEREDLQRCTQRHSTSKIQTAEDLLKIASMGFRGEALASISAVSRMRIQSKVDSETIGHMLQLSAGKLKEISPVGMPTGTSVTVTDLFYNLPARKKFLKKSSTEFQHILSLVTSFALAFPEVGFVLTHNQRNILNLPITEMAERIQKIMGKTSWEHLIPVMFDHPHLQIKGWIGKPQLSTKRQQFLFVNRRNVQANLVRMAIREAYGTLLAPQHSPFFILFLTLPPEIVDVNVHPRKEEVKFVNPNFIFTSVRNAILHTLQKADLTFTIPLQPSSKRSPEELRSPTLSPVYPDSTSRQLPEGSSYQVPPEPFPWESEELEKTTATSEILQVHNLYLVTQIPEGVLILDQHAAHERILYEQFLHDLKETSPAHESQPFLLARPFDLPLEQAEILRRNLKIFHQLGFQIEKLGENSFRVKSVPNSLREKEVVSLIRAVVEDLTFEKSTQTFSDQRLRTLSFLACRSAVKSGDYLSPQERQELLKKLSQTKTEYTCPHGRPVKVKMSLSELAKMFLRK